MARTLDWKLHILLILGQVILSLGNGWNKQLIFIVGLMEISTMGCIIAFSTRGLVAKQWTTTKFGLWKLTTHSAKRFISLRTKLFAAWETRLTLCVQFLISGQPKLITRVLINLIFTLNSRKIGKDLWKTRLQLGGISMTTGLRWQAQSQYCSSGLKI